jgi:hypothetical protein
MSSFVVVSGVDSESARVYASLGGTEISPRIGRVYWWGTAEGLYHYLASLVPEIILVVSLNGDCFVGPLKPGALVSPARMLSAV